MLSKKTNSIFLMAQIESLRDFHSKASGNSSTVSTPLDTDGSAIIPVDISYEPVVDLLTKLRYFKEPANPRGTYKDSHAFVDTLTSGIIEISEYLPFEQCINTAYNIYKSVGKEKFYGIFLVSKAGNKLNPLHPLIAMEISETQKNTEYKMYIYSYSNRNANDSSMVNDFSRVKDIKNIRSNVAAQIAAYSNKLILSQSFVSNTSFADLKKNFDSGRDSVGFNVNTAYSVTDSDGKTLSNKTPMIMIPHTLLNAGLILPYYGTSIVQLNGNTKGHVISPMLSANISNDPSTTPYNLSSNNYPSYGVCTGRENKKTLKGLRTLNHSNLRSPLTSGILAPGWRDYAEECVRFAFMVYENILTDYEGEAAEPVEPVFENVFQEWKHNNPDAPMKDYIEFIKTKNEEVASQIDPAGFV